MDRLTKEPRHRNMSNIKNKDAYEMVISNLDDMGARD